MKLAASALALSLLLTAPSAWSQPKAASESVEMFGVVGGRSALLILHSGDRGEGGSRVAGEYIVLPTLVRRFLEGERSPQLGVTTLREGNTPILFGRSPTGELRGTWRAATFKGMRYGPGGQERERFEFSEDFPGMDAYSAAVRCEAQDARYSSALSYTVEGGKLKALDWQSRIAPSGHVCSVTAAEQQPLKGGLRFQSGACSVTLRELGDFVKVTADNCAQQCGSQAYLEPLLIDRRGQCRLLRPEPR
jgi:hypothetical protein